MSLAVSPRAFSVWQRNRDAFLRQWRSSAGGFLAEPFFILTAVGFGIGALVTGEMVESQSYAHFVAPGILTSYAMFHSSFECTFGAYMRMETHRIFHGIIVTPVSAEEAALGEVLWGATRSALGGVAVLSIATLFGLVSSPLAILAIPVAFMVGMMFASMALSLTAVAPAMSILENYFTLFATPMFFFGGVFFPVEELPAGVKVVSQLLPLTPAANVVRDLFQGTPGLDTLASLGLMALYIAVFLPLALFLMRRRLVV